MFEMQKEDHLNFFQYGMDREIPEWVPCSWNLPVLNLGAGNKTITGTIEFDWPEWNAETDELPFEDNSVGGIFCTHMLEHLQDPRPIIREAARVLRPGSPFNIIVPEAGSALFYQDLDHKTAFNLDTWSTLFGQYYYTKDKHGFSFEVRSNFTMAIKNGNIALVTQLIKIEEDN